MKCLVFALTIVSLLAAGRARAQSRVSIEVGGAIAASDFGGGQSPGSAASALHQSAMTGSSSAGGGVGGVGSADSTSVSRPGDGLTVAELRPTVFLDNGILAGVGFRVGQAGIGNGPLLVGTDVSVGFQHPFGIFVPFIKATGGLNTYDLPAGTGTGPQRATVWRIDAVLGARVYLSQKMFLSGSVFAGYGDVFGGALAVGGDVVQLYRKK